MDNMINLTVESVLRTLDELVEEYGEDHVYQTYEGVDDQGPSCRYAVKKDGKVVPDCIVGHVLVRHGFPIGDLEYKGARSGEYATNSIKRNLPYMADEGLLTYEEDVKDVLQTAQSMQDCGYSWGTAVVAAKDKVS